MKFRVEHDVLAEAVAWAARSLPVRPPVPVLSGLLVEAEGSQVRLSGFDYDVSARVEVEAEVAEPGRALVSGRLLADISRALPDRPVQVAGEGTKVVVTGGAARFSLPRLPDDDYPTLPEMPQTSGSLDAEAFARAVSQVAIAAGRDDSLPVLTGIRVEIDGDTLTLAATDRYRLAVRELTWKPGQVGVSAVALVPARTLHDTARSLTAGDVVSLALATGGGQSLIGFEGGGRRTTARLLDGEFPRYRALLPSESSAHATVATDELVEAVKRVALVAERSTPVRLGFSSGEVILEAEGDDAQASEAVACTFDGEPLVIAFNPSFLLDGLGALDSPYAQLAFTAPTKPAVIAAKPEPDGEASSAYRYLLMPVRLSG